MPDLRADNAQTVPKKWPVLTNPGYGNPGYTEYLESKQDLNADHKLEIEDSRSPLTAPTVKPLVRYKVSGSTLGGLTKAMRDGVDVSTDMVKEFLVLNARAMKAKALVNMSSYGIKIADKDDEVTPLHWIRLEESPNTAEKYDDAAASDAESMRIIAMFKIMMNQRIGQVRHLEARALLVSRVNEQYAALGGTVDNKEENPWDHDEDVIRLIACYDMFWSVFKDHPTSKVRMTTVTMRDRDLTVYKAVCELARASGQTLSELAAWMWTVPLVEQFDRVCMEEVTQDHHLRWSYIHYAKAFGMCSTSPLAVAAAPELYTFVCLCGLSKSLSRATNAMIPKNVDLTMFILPVYYYAMAFGSTTQLIAMYTRNYTQGQKDAAAIERRELETDGSILVLQALLRRGAIKARRYFFSIIDGLMQSERKEGTILRHIEQMKIRLMEVDLREALPVAIPSTITDDSGSDEETDQ